MQLDRAIIIWGSIQIYPNPLAMLDKSLRSPSRSTKNDLKIQSLRSGFFSI